MDGGTAFVTGIDPETFDRSPRSGVLEGSVADPGAPNASRVHQDIAANEGWRIGDTVTVECPATGEAELEVAAIYAENG